MLVQLTHGRSRFKYVARFDSISVLAALAARELSKMK
jgi:hypothetical protein